MYGEYDSQQYLLCRNLAAGKCCLITQTIKKANFNILSRPEGGRGTATHFTEHAWIEAEVVGEELWEAVQTHLLVMKLPMDTHPTVSVSVFIFFVCVCVCMYVRV